MMFNDLKIKKEKEEEESKHTGNPESKDNPFSLQSPHHFVTAQRNSQDDR